jgi:ABC-type polysaccharide/polyol phosphate export permease
VGSGGGGCEVTTHPPRRPAPARLAGAATNRLVELVRARQLLVELVRKELKVRYRNSALGFLWSMLTPVLMTAVFSLVFTLLAPIPVDDYPAFFVSGYLLWQFFHNSCQGALQSVVINGDLVKKVYFPREVLPLSHVLAQLVHLLLALLVLSPYLVATRGTGVVVYLPVTLFAVAALTVFTAGAAMLFAGVNVVFRDLQELFVVLFQVWFYATPVIYPLALVGVALDGRPDWLQLLVETLVSLNPATWFVELFRAGAYGSVVRVGEGLATSGPGWPPVATAVFASGWAVLVLVVGTMVFHRRARTFAKEV